MTSHDILTHNNLKGSLLTFSSFDNKGLGPRIRPFYFEKMAKSSCYGTSLQCRSTLVITRYDVLFLNDMSGLGLCYGSAVLYYFVLDLMTF